MARALARRIRHHFIALENNPNSAIPRHDQEQQREAERELDEIRTLVAAPTASVTDVI